MCEVVNPQDIKERPHDPTLLVLCVIGYLRVLFCFFCCKANLSIIGNAKQVEFTVLLIKYFLIQLWIYWFKKNICGTILGQSGPVRKAEFERKTCPLDGAGDEYCLSFSGF